MSRIYRYSFLIVLAAATLACGLLAPLTEAKDIASTAKAFATANPIGTLEAVGTALPDVGQYLNPTGQPVADWKGFPIMPQATAGQEFSDNIYSFKIDAKVEDVQAFYKDQLEPQGWSQPFSVPGSAEGGGMLFMKESDFLTITIAPVDSGGVVVVLTKS
jgi:hypothetical protein